MLVRQLFPQVKTPHDPLQSADTKKFHHIVHVQNAKAPLTNSDGNNRIYSFQRVDLVGVTPINH